MAKAYLIGPESNVASLNLIRSSTIAPRFAISSGRSFSFESVSKYRFVQIQTPTLVGAPPLPGPEHVLAFAPTRNGKGVGLVIPSLLAWEESAVIYDIKR